VLAYPIEELLAEKLRSLLERGKSRDYYDVWRLLKEKSPGMDFELLSTVLLKKLAHKCLNIKEIDDFIPENTDTLKEYWRIELEEQIIQIPPLNVVIMELRDMLRKLIAPYFKFPGNATK
jgi:uncharacterized protein